MHHPVFGMTNTHKHCVFENSLPSVSKFRLQEVNWEPVTHTRLFTSQGYHSDVSSCFSCLSPTRHRLTVWICLIVQCLGLIRRLEVCSAGYSRVVLRFFRVCIIWMVSEGVRVGCMLGSLLSLR